MGKFNLADAAKAILTEGSKETFQANISSTQGGKDKPAKLPTSVAYGTKDAGQVGQSPEEMKDANPDYTKGVPTATPPGATPPVGSEPMQKLKGQPGESEGSEHDVVQEPSTDYSSIRDRVKAKLAKQTMQPNPGATFQSYGEETEEEEGELVSEEEKGEGHEDAAEDKAMIKKAIQKEKMKEREEFWNHLETEAVKNPKHQLVANILSKSTSGSALAASLNSNQVATGPIVSNEDQDEDASNVSYEKIEAEAREVINSVQLFNAFAVNVFFCIGEAS